MGQCVCPFSKKDKIIGKTFLDSSKTAFTNKINPGESVKLEDDLELESKKHIKRIINIAVLGDSGVGKSSCIIKYVYNKFENYHIVSIDTEIYEKEIVLRNSIYKLNFFVEASDQNYKSEENKLSEIADIILYFFDFSKKSSYESIIRKLEASINNITKKHAVIGNKLDIWKKEVSPSESRLYFSNLSVEYLELSTKTFNCLEKKFNNLFEKLLND